MEFSIVVERQGFTALKLRNLKSQDLLGVIRKIQLSPQDAAILRESRAGYSVVVCEIKQDESKRYHISASSVYEEIANELRMYINAEE